MSSDSGYHFMAELQASIIASAYLVGSIYK